MNDVRQLDGDSYDVMLRNLWCLLMAGGTLEKPKPIVLERPGVRTPSPPPRAHRSTIH